MPMNMKTYLPTLFFFFLLLDTSVSPPNPMAGFYRAIFKQIGKQLANEAYVPVPGLHLAKQYLYSYGYIQYSNPFADLMDEETVSAIKAFGDMRLDAARNWTLPTDYLTSWSWERGEVDLGTVVMHQFGHLLGLSHSSHVDSVMYLYILPSRQRKLELSYDDDDQIQASLFLWWRRACRPGWVQLGTPSK